MRRQDQFVVLATFAFALLVSGGTRPENPRDPSNQLLGDWTVTAPHRLQTFAVRQHVAHPPFLRSQTQNLFFEGFDFFNATIVTDSYIRMLQLPCSFEIVGWFVNTVPWRWEPSLIQLKQIVARESRFTPQKTSGANDKSSISDWTWSVRVRARGNLGNVYLALNLLLTDSSGECSERSDALFSFYCFSEPTRAPLGVLGNHRASLQAALENETLLHQGTDAKGNFVPCPVFRASNVEFHVYVSYSWATDRLLVTTAAEGSSYFVQLLSIANAGMFLFSSRRDSFGHPRHHADLCFRIEGRTEGTAKRGSLDVLSADLVPLDAHKLSTREHIQHWTRREQEALVTFDLAKERALRHQHGEPEK